MTSKHKKSKKRWWCSFAQSCPTLRLHELQKARLPCISLFSGARSNSCPLSRWCHPTIILCRPLLLLPSIFPSIRSFPVSRLFSSGGQNIGALASASVLPKNIQSWFPLGWTGLISLQSKGSKESSPASQFESINSSTLSLLCGPTLRSIHDYWKDHSFDSNDLCQQSDVFVF